MAGLISPYVALLLAIIVCYICLARAVVRLQQTVRCSGSQIVRSTKPLRWLWITLIAAGILPACTLGSQEMPARGSSPPVAQQPASMTLTLWHSWSGAKLEALNKLARDYEQAYPRVRLDLQTHPAAEIMRTYSMSVADGSAPQLLLIPGRYLGELAERQYIMPLDLQDRVFRSLLPSAVESVRINGQIYALPLTFDTLVLFYDRRRVVTPPTTFSQLVALNQPQPNHQQTWSLGYYLSLEQTLPYLSAFGGVLVDENGEPSFATEARNATIHWLEWLQGLQRDPNVLASPDFSAVDAEVQQGRVLAVIDWAYRRTDYAQVWGTDAVGIASLPALDDQAQPRTMLLPEVICINVVTSPEQRTAAQAFLRYLADRSAQTVLAEQSRGQLLPVHTGIALPAQLQAILEAARQSQPLAPPLTTARVWRPLNDMLRNVLLNAAPVAETVDSAGVAISKQER